MTASTKRYLMKPKNIWVIKTTQANHILTFTKISSKKHHPSVKPGKQQNISFYTVLDGLNAEKSLGKDLNYYR